MTSQQGDALASTRAGRGLRRLFAIASATRAQATDFRKPFTHSQRSLFRPKPPDKGHACIRGFFRWARFMLVAVLGLVLGALSPVRAAGVLQLSFEELCLQAALIVEGRVVEVDARQDSSSPFIWTYVTIDVTELIHGNLDNGQVVLAYLGGSAGGRTLRVADMEVPRLGEHGIYFVEAKDRRQVHPLLGWQQGHFRVETDADGVERVTSSGRPVLSATAPASARSALSAGRASGVEVAGADESTDRAMRPGEFKTSIRDLLSGRPVLSP